MNLREMCIEMKKQDAKTSRRHADKKTRRKNILRERKRGNLVELKSPRKRAIAACDFAVSHCFYESEIFETGIGTVVIARTASPLSVGTSVFLVDAYCLGVKNAFFREYTPDQFREFKHDIVDSGGVITDCEPDYARKLVEKAVAYAKALGFEPHPDFAIASALFGSIDANLCKTEFEMGHEGKPLYVASPMDNDTKIRKILRTLNSNVGAGNFEYLLPADENSDWLED
jgi:hypothetical protein